MAEDTEVLREIWKGRIPVSFQLSPDEIVGNEEPDPIYRIVHRQSYFPIYLTEKLHKYFKRFIDPEAEQDDVWLEDQNGRIIKWHRPIGVLFDMEYFSKIELPWVILVHYRNFPQMDLVRYSCKEAIESHFMCGIKEADFLKHRSTTLTTMKNNDDKKLFKGLATDNFDMFWSVNKRLMEGQNDEKYFKQIPFRVYDSLGNMIQCRFTPVDKSGRENTLFDLFKCALPSLFEDVVCPETVQPDLSGGDNDDIKEADDVAVAPKSDVTADPPETPTSSLDVTSECDKIVKFKYLIQGITPPLEIPVQWLSEHLSYPDNFLHICISSLSDKS